MLRTEVDFLQVSVTWIEVERTRAANGEAGGPRNVRDLARTVEMSSGDAKLWSSTSQS